jgi:hypothetical protein
VALQHPPAAPDTARSSRASDVETLPSTDTLAQLSIYVKHLFDT